MAIVSVSKMWSKNTSDATLNDTFTKLSISFQEAYQVVTSPGATFLEVYSATDPITGEHIPGQGQTFPDFDYCYAMSAKPQQVSPIFWIVSVDYKGEAGGDITQSPLLKPTSVSWSDSSTMEELDQDFNGQPLVNANGEPIRGIKVELVDDVITLKKNFLTFSPYVRGMYRRAVNSDTFRGWPPGTGKVKQFDAQNVFEETSGYWQVTLKVQFRYPYNTTPAKAWYSRTLHQGHTARATVGGPIFRAVSGEKADSNKPVMLDANGLQISNPALAYFIEKQLYGSLPFNALGF